MCASFNEISHAYYSFPIFALKLKIELCHKQWRLCTIHNVRCSHPTKCFAESQNCIYHLFRIRSSSKPIKTHKTQTSTIYRSNRFLTAHTVQTPHRSPATITTNRKPALSAPQSNFKQLNKDACNAALPAPMPTGARND